jgi:hypothetical protein
MTTTPERIETLARMRSRLKWLIHSRPFYKQTIKDTRIIIDALEALVFVDMKGTIHANEKRS